LPPGVIPAQAGTQSGTRCTKGFWAPAFAGVTVRGKTGSLAEFPLFGREADKADLRLWGSRRAPAHDRRWVDFRMAVVAVWVRRAAPCAGGFVPKTGILASQL
jgi:hypothetical protein